MITARSSWFGLSSRALQTCCCCATGNSGHDPRIGSGELWWTAGNLDIDFIVSLSGYSWDPHISFGFQDFMKEHEGLLGLACVHSRNDPMTVFRGWIESPGCAFGAWGAGDARHVLNQTLPSKKTVPVAGLGLCADRT